MDLNRSRTRTTRIAAGAAFLAAAVAATGTPPASADPTGGTSHRLQVLCGAAGGDFHSARFGYWRCQDARLDGMGTFWAVRTVCERAAERSYLEATNIPEAGRGTWTCAPR
ncbi:hypothetical protein EXE59_06190 [Nocardioides eburneiflavus]|uniref:Secreted protein n=1 Tax=Nocardioides eburneiflavus TaxID=2518372 RepID=A0A4Z1CD55_9ACTN|nr:hypothetical protein [Nocardioides eburneiflavus]TGN63585.1 hypothetical protein EXE59_06190 [Nocardioides eburneiflavus]